jgi:SAM-dependent methyltransferase
MSSARFIVGDVFEGLATLPDDSVDLIFTSPPFLALRSYLPADHPDKAKEIGAEPTPAAFIDTLLDVTEELARVLAPHGSVCVELGDTYASAGGTTDNREESLGGNDFAPRGRRAGGSAGWPLDKSLCLIPESYRWALTYGRNPFNGRETEPWRTRNVLRWHRPNPPVGALGDKFRPSTSDVVVATKSRTRYFDLDAVRSPAREDKIPPSEGWNDSGARPSSLETGRERFAQRLDTHGGMAPPLDTWIIPTEPYKGAHYATFPSDLVVKPVAAMCPERVCLVCGAPSRRIVDVSYVDSSGKPAPRGEWKSGVSEGMGAHSLKTEVRTTTTTTLGWTDCGHDSWRRGLVLDPFCGSGTVLAVASGHGRDSVGIDLDERNAELARHRVGMFLVVQESVHAGTRPVALAREARDQAQERQGEAATARRPLRLGPA